MDFSYQKSCLVDEMRLVELLEQMRPEIERINAARSLGYQTPYASINVPADQEMVQHVKQVVHEKQALKPAALVVIGIGGSNLGTKAVHEALRGQLHNELDELKVYYADTVDTQYIDAIMRCVEQHLKSGQNIILNVISKSGGTTETIANFQIFLSLLKKYTTDYQRYVVVTTDYQSPLWHIAREQKFACLEIPALVGGRYSVFCPVGLFPLGLMGIDIQALVQGAQSAIARYTQDTIENYAAVRACILAELYRTRVISIHDFFVFAVNLQSIGAWYRQLMGESIGKAHDIRGNKVEVGIIPTVSVGSTDLHSVAQLYLGGPRIVVTTFLTVKTHESSLRVGHDVVYANIADAIQNKTLAHIMQAIVGGVQAAYRDQQRPFMSIELSSVSAAEIGALMQMCMLEMIYLGYLLEVNPFDQPQVELYKKETRKILANE